MTESSDQVARAAAARLATELPDGLVPSVEAELASGDETLRTFADPGTVIALASLLVSAASLAWTIYRDLKSDSAAKPAAQVVERRVTLRLIEQGKDNSPHFDRVVEVVSEEVVRVDPE